MFAKSPQHSGSKITERKCCFWRCCTSNHLWRYCFTFNDGQSGHDGIGQGTGCGSRRHGDSTRHTETPDLETQWLHTDQIISYATAGSAGATREPAQIRPGQLGNRPSNTDTYISTGSAREPTQTDMTHPGRPASRPRNTNAHRPGQPESRPRNTYKASPGSAREPTQEHLLA